MQPRARLVGDQYIGRRFVGDVDRSEPGRMARTVGLPKARDGLGINLQPAAGCWQRVCLGIVAKGAQIPAVVGLLRQETALAWPELGKARRGQSHLGEPLARWLVEMFEPLAY